MSECDFVDELILRNQQWSLEKCKSDPEYFSRHVEGQRPRVLWITCVDSRVLPDVLADTTIGEMLVHRNVANQILASDQGTFSAVEFAVESMSVGHIVVCGHSHCGGVTASCVPDLHAMDSTPALQQWLSPIHTHYLEKREMLEQAGDVVEQMVRLNVLSQISQLAELDLIRNRWAKGRAPVLHGLVYALEDGHLDRIVRHSREGIEYFHG